MPDFSVLIIGAGPTGMELASELERYDINFLIIDKRPSYITTSNAAGIHARTLECWHKRPWLDAFLQQGLKMQGASIRAFNKKLAEFNFTNMQNTQYPFVLSIPQNDTEAILDQHLNDVGRPVMRDATLTNLIIRDDYVIAEVESNSGKKKITADWVVGCDGYHSSVRELAKNEFIGKDIEERFFLIDADFSADYNSNQFHVFLSSKGPLAFFPMPDSTRIIAGVGKDPEFKDVKEPTLEIMDKIIQQRSNLKFKLKTISWQNHFWIHERVAKEMQFGRAFIAGDAAHVHSPVGGQGMNTGIQDSHNLAWKLAYVIKQYAPPKLLLSYQPERLAIAKGVVGMTAALTRLVNIHNPILTALRNWVMPYFTQQKLFQKIMVGRMSELSLNYPHSPINEGKRIGKFAPGDRALDVLVDKNNQVYLFDLIHDKKFHAIIFHAQDYTKKELMALQNKYQHVLQCHFFTSLNSDINNLYAFKHFTICLIRPDQYIAFLGEKMTDFESYLSRIFLDKENQTQFTAQEKSGLLTP